MKELKLKAELESTEKDKAEIALEELQVQLDKENIPKCPVGNKRFSNTDILEGRIDITHNAQKTTEGDNLSRMKVNVEEMENSEHSGYGNTEDYQLVSVQCKKCDEKVQNNHLLKIHMRKHNQKEQKILKCTNCTETFSDENRFLNHIVDTHSTAHDCQTCKKIFSTKKELVAHIVRDHDLEYSTNNTTQATSAAMTPSINQIKCFDCGTLVQTRDALMRHKKVQHWKQKLCPYYHGTGRGCRFPDRLCFNIHRLDEQHQGRVVQEGHRQEVRSNIQEVQEQGAGDQGRQEISWARVAGGQRPGQGAWGQEGGQDQGGWQGQGGGQGQRGGQGQGGGQYQGGWQRQGGG